ncbi:MAG: SCP2 sterol-binding domain-containing protein [Haloarculaceae archaeon]
MGATLPDEADKWADRLQERVNGGPFAEAAGDFEATFRFEILPDDAYIGDPVALTVVVADGACVAARGFDRDAGYDFALRGPYTVWKDLLEDEVELTAAVMGGPLDLDGSTIKLMQHREAVTELVRAARAVDTDYAY